MIGLTAATFEVVGDAGYAKDSLVKTIRALWGQIPIHLRML
jgi:hypothetical protein